MKKFFIIGGIAAFVAASAAVLVVLFNLGPIIRKAVNTYGPEMTKTEVRLGDAGISLFAGKATLKDLYIGNPGGFTAKEALTAASILVSVDRKSLAQDTIIIDRIELLGPSITYERQGKTDNFRTIMDNMSRYGGEAGKGGGGKGGSAGRERKLLIREFIIRDGNLKVLVPGLSGRSLTAAMPDIHLKDIGSDGAGAAPSEIFGQIFGALYGKIVSTSAGGITGGAEAAGSAIKGGGKATKEGLDTATGRVKGFFGR